MYSAVVMTELIPIYSRGRYEGLARLVVPAGRPDHTRNIQPWRVLFVDPARSVIRDVSLDDITPTVCQNSSLST